ncbi:TetR/AcrR family transcriptional regulator [Caulobacter segnis]|uniref:TetR/AcrR family transcriptional regulator n=1 Tax=Caulobacter segnis TaxID=88688 RepID=UPI0024105683|nr:TetR/AcrR family transcriptional regulator [Caulobacter segnis]MDG2523255.1 TetR/AcrR family transcriptional regulator [Caulobacter segnis]
MARQPTRTSVSRSPRKRKGQGGERREEILGAALRLIGERGVHGVSTRQIAEAVGISQPSLYAYFPSRDAIVEELHDRAFVLLVQALDRFVPTPGTPLEQAVEYLRVYVDFGLNNPDAYRVAFMIEGAGKPKPPTDESPPKPALQAFNSLRAAIWALHESGRVRDQDPEVISQSLWAGVHGLVSLLIARPQFPWAEREALIRTHLTMLAHGVLKDA